MRLALALAVMWSHAFGFADAASDPLGRWTSGRLEVGPLAVNAFFAISGYLIAMSYVRSAGPRDFLRRRLMRILPGHAAAYLISALVVTPIACGSIARALTPYHLARAAGYWVTFGPWMHPDAFPDNPMRDQVNGSIWTIRYELVCYLVLMAFGVAGMLRRPRLVLTFWLAAVACATLIAALPGLQRPVSHGVVFLAGDPYAYLRFATYFGAGTVLYLFAEHVPRSPLLAAAAALLAVACCSRAVLSAAVMPAALTYLIFWLATARTPAVGRFAATVGGDYS